VLGAGLIGCEFANDLILGGYQVELVAPCEHVMPGLLHPSAATAVQAGLEGLGARFHLGPVLASLQRNGDALHAHLSDGTLIECDLVLSAVAD
jgi:rubredoxin-NAD+ reductase